MEDSGRVVDSCPATGSFPAADSIMDSATGVGVRVGVRVGTTPMDGDGDITHIRATTPGTIPTDITHTATRTTHTITIPTLQPRAITTGTIEEEMTPRTAGLMTPTATAALGTPPMPRIATGSYKAMLTVTAASLRVTPNRRAIDQPPRESGVLSLELDRSANRDLTQRLKTVPQRESGVLSLES